MDSLSSGLILGTTLYRNSPGILNKCIAQVGYALIAVVSSIETVAALIFSAFCLLLHPVFPTPFDHCTKWLSSSGFSFAWSVANFALNLFTEVLVADERSARIMLKNRDPITIPEGAILYPP